MVGPSFGAFIAEQSDEANRGKMFGISEGIFMLVAVVGPPLGGILADRFGFKFMFLVAGLLYGTASLLRFWMANQVRRTSEASPRALSMQSLRSSLGTMLRMALAGGLVTWILVTDGVRDVAGTLSFELLPVYLQDIGGVSVEGVGWLTSLFGIAMMAFTLPSGWLADRLGERVPIAAGFVTQSLALVFMLSVRGFLGFAVAWGLFGVGMGLMNPAYNSLVSKAIPERLRGTAFGLLQTSVGLFSLPAPYIGAQLWERLSPQTPFLITAGGLLLAVLPVWLRFRLRPAAAPVQESAEPA
jgi:MFS family permease